MDAKAWHLFMGVSFMDPFDLFWFRTAIGVTIGLIFGSFATMLTYRLPRGISIISPPSHCPKCKARLTPRDLIPVFSWIANRGKCRHCLSPIGKRYLIIELVVTLMFTVAFIHMTAS